MLLEGKPSPGCLTENGFVGVCGGPGDNFAVFSMPCDGVAFLSRLVHFFLTGKIRRGLCRDGAVDESFFFLLVDWSSTLVYAVSQTSI